MTKTLLWKFWRKDPNDCQYILGTIHTSTQEAMQFRDLAEACIDRVALYAGEMDLNAVDENTLLHFLRLPGEQKLSDLFSVRKYTRYKRLISKACHLDLDDLARFSPFYITNLLAEQSLPRTAGMPLDHALWTYATLAGKDMTGLESFQDQCSIMQQIPLDYQIKTFKDSMRRFNTFRKKTGLLNTLYAAGELDLLYKYSKKSMGSMRKLMIYERNQKMIHRISELISSQSCFIAVGAAHLGGDKGIIAGLKRNGYNFRMIRQLSDI